MKQIVITVFAAATVACSSIAPDPGQEAVVVMKPILFGSGGVDPTPVKTGLQWVAATTSAVYVDMRPKQQEVAFDDLFTSDGVPLDFHAAIQYRITDSVKLVRDFGADDSPQGMGFFVRTLSQPFQMLVRDAVKKHGLNEMAINVTAAQSVDDEVTRGFVEVIKRVGAPIELLGVTLGRASPPDAIKHQRIATAEQEQRQLTERQAKKAEDERKAREESRAAADRAYNENIGISTQANVELEKLKILAGACAKGGCNVFLGGGAVPTLSVK